MRLSEGVEGISKRCSKLSKFSRWLPFSRWTPLKIADVSDLSDPYCDLNENSYRDAMYFDGKKSIANEAILKW
jgi:hypothetical protein